MDTLPENIVSKILLFVSHPVADIVRTSSEFHYRFLDSEGRNMDHHLIEVVGMLILIERVTLINGITLKVKMVVLWQS